MKCPCREQRFSGGREGSPQGRESKGSLGADVHGVFAAGRRRRSVQGSPGHRRE
jgi:hypothetical protein